MNNFNLQFRYKDGSGYAEINKPVQAEDYAEAAHLATIYAIDNKLPSHALSITKLKAQD